MPVVDCPYALVLKELQKSSGARFPSTAAHSEVHSGSAVDRIC